MTPVELFSATAAVLSLLVGALSAMAAFRSADSARAAQRSAEEAAKRSALLSAALAAADILAEVQRVESAAAHVKAAYDTLGVFSGSYENSGIEQSKATVTDLAAQAEECARYARLFSDAGSKLRDASSEEVDRVQVKLATSRATVMGLCKELERMSALVDGQNAQHRERRLSK